MIEIKIYTKNLKEHIISHVPDDFKIGDIVEVDKIMGLDDELKAAIKAKPDKFNEYKSYYVRLVERVLIKNNDIEWSYIGTLYKINLFKRIILRVLWLFRE